jgi:hypothetical protein
VNCHRNPEVWEGVRVLLDALNTLGTSDDETDDECKHLNRDGRFKTVRRIDTGFLNPAISRIWKSVETYPLSLRPSRGNRSFKRIAKANTTSKRKPIQGLPMNFYDANWLERAPPRFREQVKEEYPLPVLVGYHTSIIRR